MLQVNETDNEMWHYKWLALKLFIGGENFELSLKIGNVRGSIAWVPCSRVDMFTVVLCLTILGN